METYGISPIRNVIIGGLDIVIDVKIEIMTLYFSRGLQHAGSRSRNLGASDGDAQNCLSTPPRQGQQFQKNLHRRCADPVTYMI